MAVSRGFLVKSADIRPIASPLEANVRSRFARESLRNGKWRRSEIK